MIIAVGIDIYRVFDNEAHTECTCPKFSHLEGVKRAVWEIDRIEELIEKMKGVQFHFVPNTADAYVAATGKRIDYYVEIDAPAKA